MTVIDSLYCIFNYNRVFTNPDNFCDISTGLFDSEGLLYYYYYCIEEISILFNSL